ncbi:MAG: hypothetical protein KDD25_03035 [Bdellovibrionales bacterium]|nr:hypothetical protein [Bdellovibrionales bacterium]
MSKMFFLLASFFFLPMPSIAQVSPEVVIENGNGECIVGQLQKLKETLVNYEEYKTIDDSIETTIWDLVDALPKLPFDISPIDMRVSKQQNLPLQAANEVSRANALFVFQPVGLDPDDHLQVFPVLPVQCVTTEDPGFVHQNCAIYDVHGKRYGLSNFNSEIQLRGGVCAGSQIHLKYRITLNTYQAHVEAMKSAVRDQYFILKLVDPELINKLFDEEKFYKRYFSDLYEAIVRSARK